MFCLGFSALRGPGEAARGGVAGRCRRPRAAERMRGLARFHDTGPRRLPGPGARPSRTGAGQGVPAGFPEVVVPGRYVLGVASDEAGAVRIYAAWRGGDSPGPGGWSALLKYGEHQKSLAGGAADTTAGRMAVTAARKHSKA